MADCNTHGWRPRLLVSVRNAAEAYAAAAGGCDILDVKEPRRGSLGRADTEVIRAVVEAAQPGLDVASPVPVSAALGELHQWQEARHALPEGVTYCKMGLAGMAGVRDWQLRWQQARRQIDASFVHPPRWVAVVYADRECAESPAPEAIIDAAAETGCAALLIDTFCKDGRGLFEWYSRDELCRLVGQARRCGLAVAAAGSLRCEDLPRLRQMAPDIVAIRGAACRSGRREATVSIARVRRIRRSMNELSSPPNLTADTARSTLPATQRL